MTRPPPLTILVAVPFELTRAQRVKLNLAVPKRSLSDCEDENEATGLSHGTKFDDSQ